MVGIEQKRIGPLGIVATFLTVGLTKHAVSPVCEVYATSHKRPFVPTVGGIRLLYLAVTCSW